MINKTHKSIKVTLATINLAIKQVPSDKKILLTSRINQVLNKYHNNLHSEAHLQNFQKQLIFNLNFIKLSHPHLNYSIEDEIEDADGKKDGVDGDAADKKEKHKVELNSSDEFVEFERIRNDSFDQFQSIRGQVREEVEFTNWFDGNVDPELLKRHKQLLQRQHFMGDFWEDKEKPKSAAKQYLKSVLAAGEPTEVPEKVHNLSSAEPTSFQQSDQYWEKVKR